MPKLTRVSFLEPCEFIYAVAVLVGAKFWIKDQDILLTAYAVSTLHVIMVMASVWETSRVAMVAVIDLLLTVAQWMLNMGWLQLPYIQQPSSDEHPIGYVKVAVLFIFLCFSIARLATSKCAGAEDDEEEMYFIDPRKQQGIHYRHHRKTYVTTPQSPEDDYHESFSPRKPGDRSAPTIRYPN
jgi:hypothetical protein